MDRIVIRDNYNIKLYEIISMEGIVFVYDYIRSKALTWREIYNLYDLIIQQGVFINDTTKRV